LFFSFPLQMVPILEMCEQPLLNAFRRYPGRQLQEEVEGTADGVLLSEEPDSVAAKEPSWVAHLWHSLSMWAPSLPARCDGSPAGHGHGHCATRGVTGLPAQRNTVRVGLYSSSALLAISIPHFGLFLNLIGSCGCSLLAFIFPALINIRAFGENASRRFLYLNYGLVVFGVVGGSMSFVLTVIELVKVSG
jgi:hypothetical protein